MLRNTKKHTHNKQNTHTTHKLANRSAKKCKALTKRPTSLHPQHSPRAPLHSTPNSTNNELLINDRPYTIPPPGTYVAMCFDGTDNDYITAAIDAGMMPNLKKITTPPDFGTFQASYLKQKADDKAAGSTSVGDTTSGASMKKLNFFQAQGHIGIAAGAFPTYTNPNHASILTGVPPIEHGICGNTYYDPIAKKNLPMTSPELIRAKSILASLYEADRENTKVTIISTKDNIKQLLLAQLPTNYVGATLPTLHNNNNKSNNNDNNNNNVTPITPTEENSNIRAFSIEALAAHPEKAAEYKDLINTTFTHADDIKITSPPSIYDPQSSIYALQLGYALFKRDQTADVGIKAKKSIFYLTTTDYVQHLHAPGSAEANALLFGLDQVLGKFHEDGAIVGFTSDHGMNDKVKFNKEPNVVYLDDEVTRILSAISPDMTTRYKPRTLLPIADPYTNQHGSLGGYATVYLDDMETNTNATTLSDTTKEKDAVLMSVFKGLRQIPGCYSVLGREDAVRGLELPPDRIGDVVILGDKHSVFGTTPSAHDFSQFRLKGQALRSHGSLEESLVPLMYNRPLQPFFKRDFGKGRIRNYDLFYNMFNGLQL